MNLQQDYILMISKNY
ncbi:UNVERIFIED_CONTAM: hypothetical protein GTU68_055680 [Idotea baltica]|nr:hypothetical protein [Idotea baltica]